VSRAGFNDQRGMADCLGALLTLTRRDQRQRFENPPAARRAKEKCAKKA
jgi:hypothetical protein